MLSSLEGATPVCMHSARVLWQPTRLPLGAGDPPRLSQHQGGPRNRRSEVLEPEAAKPGTDKFNIEQEGGASHTEVWGERKSQAEGRILAVARKRGADLGEAQWGPAGQEGHIAGHVLRWVDQEATGGLEQGHRSHLHLEKPPLAVGNGLQAGPASWGQDPGSRPSPGLTLGCCPPELLPFYSEGRRGFALPRALQALPPGLAAQGQHGSWQTRAELGTTVVRRGRDAFRGQRQQNLPRARKEEPSAGKREIKGAAGGRG